jgi:hypothetical protein
MSRTSAQQFTACRARKSQQIRREVRRAQAVCAQGAHLTVIHPYVDKQLFDDERDDDDKLWERKRTRKHTRECSLELADFSCSQPQRTLPALQAIQRHGQEGGERLVAVDERARYSRDGALNLQRGARDARLSMMRAR